MSTRSYFLIIILLSPLILSHSFAIDVYVPAMPDIANLFQVSAGQMQHTLTVFMLTTGIMQLFAGPLSDAYGRKRLLYCLVFIFGTGTLLCSFAATINALIVFRGVQAIGTCGMMVVAFAVVRDLFSGKKLAEAFSILIGVSAISSIGGPFLGSYLDVHFQWMATFRILLILALLSLIALYYLPETLPPNDREIFRLNGLFKIYVDIFKNKTFLIYTVSTGIGLSYLYIFSSISPYVIMTMLHLSPLYYSYCYAVMGVSILIGSVASTFIIEQLDIYKTTVIGFCISLMGGLCMMLWYFIQGLTIANFMWPMLFIGIGGTIALSAGSGGALNAITKNIGSASALCCSLRFIFIAIVGASLIHADVQSTLLLSIPAVVFSFFAIGLFARKKKMLMSLSG